MGRHVPFARSSNEVVAFVLAFAGGAVLTTLSFTLAFALEQLD